MTTKAESVRASLSRRIRQFYSLLNASDFPQCYLMIDPRVRDKSERVTLLQYENALRRFLETVGHVEVLQIRNLEFHLDEPNKLYEGRPFAIGKTIWVDKTEDRFEFSERWVYENSVWYTRSTGLIKPTQSISQNKTQTGSSIVTPKKTSYHRDKRVSITKPSRSQRPKAKLQVTRENTRRKPD